MPPRDLDGWLSHIDGVHRVGIDLGLERVGRVAGHMGFAAPEHRPAPRSVIVAGTNGKGSTCVALEALLRTAGLRVGTTLSPHLHRFNERVRIDGEMAPDAALCEAFARVEEARGRVPLTYFEFSALAALDCFRRAGVDVAVLEVGLGGRLDAFNLVTADVAVITSIGLDHQAFLGDDLEQIGREKAGVMRSGQQLVLGADVTASVEQEARRLGCDWTRLGRDFHIHCDGRRWSFRSGPRTLRDLPLGPFAPANCALALEAAAHLVTLPDRAVAEALEGTTLPGRMETWRVGPTSRRHLLVLDVAHNPAGAGFLAEQLAQRYPDRRFVAVLGMLEDKDADGVVTALKDQVRHWVCVPTRGPRGQSAAILAERLRKAGAAAAEPVSDVGQGLERALSSCPPGDDILAFGSFDLVERMRDALMAGQGGAQLLAEPLTGRPMDSLG